MCVVKPIFADTSIDVSARVGETEISLNGYASPFSVVTFMENNAVIGTAVTDINGSFSKQFNTLDEGVHTLNIFVVDQSGKTNRTVSLSYVVIAGQNVDLSDLYLPPTINAGNYYHEGDTVNVFGYSLPNQSLQINLTGKKQETFLLLSNASGYYSLGIKTANFELGNYSVTTTLNHSSSVSTISENIDFVLTAMPTSVPQYVSPTNGLVQPTSRAGRFSPAPTMTSVIPTGVVILPTPSKEKLCPYEFINLCFFDKEKKGWIDAEKELPGILKNMGEQFGERKNTVYDINEDFDINEKDLSIVLYYVRDYPYELIQSFVKNGSGYLRILAPEKVMPLIYIDLLQKAALIAIILFILFIFIRRRRKKRNRKLLLMVIFFGLIFLIFLFVDSRLPDMRIQPTRAQFVNVGEAAFFDVKFDTGHTVINVVSVDISYDPGFFEIQEIDSKNSFANVFLKKEFDNGVGRIRIVGGVTGVGYVGDNGSLARINFVARKPGKTKIVFEKDSIMVAANGKGDTIYTRAKDYTLDIR